MIVEQLLLMQTGLLPPCLPGSLFPVLTFLFPKLYRAKGATPRWPIKESRYVVPLYLILKASFFVLLMILIIVSFYYLQFISWLNKITLDYEAEAKADKHLVEEA